MRLLKYLTKCDVASRRKCDKLILGGHILVDGKVVNKPFVNIIPGENTVKVNGKICSPTENYYLMLNKPPGYTCSLKDEHAEKLAVDLITLEDKNIRLFSVGRLDKDSEGLILFTNDGDFANNIGHPSKGVVKTYKVSVRGELTRTVIKKIQFGIFSDGEKLTVKDIKISRNTKTGGTLAFKLVEGRKREIRRICAAVGLHVIRLRRTKMGSLTLSGLRPGKWKFLTDSDMRKIEK